MQAICTEKLTKFYGKVRGIIDLDLTVAEGEFFGFIGPNGAGKSTTIRTLLGLIRPTGGSAQVLGLDIRSSREEILRLIHDMPGEDPLWEEDETLRKQLHASILSRGDRRELVRLIRSLYLHKKERESKGKKFHQCDERCLKEAEELINSEFSLVLPIPPQQVVSFIRQQLEGPSPETA